jgi:uncharacterized protein
MFSPLIRLGRVFSQTPYRSERLKPNPGQLVLPNASGMVYSGWGALGISLFAGEAIAAGDTVLRLSGAVISFEEAVSRGEQQCYPLQISARQYLDIEAPACYANHSCDPNTGILDDVNLVALAPISKGEEIRFDYSTTMDEDYWTMECRCGSRRCRKVVTDFKLLPEDVRKSYLARGLVVSFISRQYGEFEI